MLMHKIDPKYKLGAAGLGIDYRTRLQLLQLDPESSAEARGEGAREGHPASEGERKRGKEVEECSVGGEEVGANDLGRGTELVDSCAAAAAAADDDDDDRQEYNDAAATLRKSCNQ
jgi:hypothetical protein